MRGPFADLGALLAQLDARIAAQPRWADLRDLRALARSCAGDADGAARDLEIALEINPEYAAARFDLRWLRGEPDDSMPAEWRDHLRIAATARARGAAEACSALEALPARAPSAWRALDRAWLAVQLERWDEAAARLAGAASEHPDRAAILGRIGLGRAGGIADRGALRLWAESYGGNPRRALVCRAASDLARHAGDSERGHDLLCWGAALDLDLGAYWIARGEQLEAQGGGDGALDALRRAVHTAPEDARAYAALGYALAARERPAEAIEALERAVALAPAYADVRYQLALLHADTGAPRESEVHLRAALAVHPGYLMARLALGSLLEAAGRDAEALHLLQGVRNGGLRSADLELRLSNLHARLGHANQARRARARARAALRSQLRAGAPQG